MKRKFLVVFLAIVATFCMAFGFAACGEKSDETGKNPSITDPSDGEQGNQGEQEENKKPIDPNHTHAFSELYYDDIYHWRKCNICGERYEIAMHSMAANDICSICGYKMEGYTKGLYYYVVITKEGVVGCSVSAGKTKPTGEVVIPAFCGGLQVLSVGSFSDCKELTSVVIPKGVTSIEYEAFYGCSELTSIDIPDSVTEIGSYAFFDTAYYNNDSNWDKAGVLYIGNRLIKAKDTISENYSIRGGTKTIANSAFMNCKRLNSIDIPDSVTSIGEWAFANCSGLTSVTIGKSVTSIGEWAFRLCSGLTSVVIPDGVTEIGDSAFYWCTGLTSATIGSAVTSIGSDAFRNCDGLASIDIPDSVTSIGSSAFAYCDGLTSINIPNSVTSIGSSAFIDTAYYNDDSNWTGEVLYLGNHFIEAKDTIAGSYSIRGGTKTIAGGVFRGCGGLISVTIPNSVTSIGEYAFAYCSGLTSITIPDSVTEIGEDAFSGCSGLTSVTIPASVTSIGEGVFYGCDGLKEVYFENPKGWKVASICYGPAEKVATAVSGLDDPVKAVKYLTDTYYNYFWKREG